MATRAVLAAFSALLLGCQANENVQSPRDVVASYDARIGRAMEKADADLVWLKCDPEHPARQCGLMIDIIMTGWPDAGYLVAYASKTCGEQVVGTMSDSCANHLRDDFTSWVGKRYPRADLRKVNGRCAAGYDCSLGSVASFHILELLFLDSHNEIVWAEYEATVKRLEKQRDTELRESEQAAEEQERRRGALRAIGAGLQAFGQSLQGATPPTATPAGSNYTRGGEASCTNDFACGAGFYCVKDQGETSGTCARVVNRYGTPQYTTPRPDSVAPGRAECIFMTECPTGFQCLKGHCMQ